MVKVVFNDVKNGKSYQKEFDFELFSGKKIGDKVNGDSLGLKDYEFLVSGGSDSAGFPLNDSFESPVRKKILVCKKGVKLRKNVRGNVFGDYMAQINLKTVKYGSSPLDKLLGAEKKEGEQPEKVEKAQIEEKPKEKAEESIKKQ